MALSVRKLGLLPAIVLLQLAPPANGMYATPAPTSLRVSTSMQAASPLTAGPTAKTSLVKSARAAQPRKGQSPVLAMSVTSAQLWGDEHATVTGQVGAPLRRAVNLQRLEGTRWVAIASTTSSRRGVYRLTDPLPRGGVYRTAAPRTRVNRQALPRRVSAAQQVVVRSGLGPNQTLQPGQFVVSPNGQYTLVMQGDGNLVQYQQGGGAKWSSATGTPGSHAVMQGDGNLVVYRPDGSAVWSSETDTFDGSNLALQDDGNLVVYQNGRAIWSTLTGKLFQRLDSGQVLGVGQSIKSTDHRFVLVMQGDGNLVLYQGSTALWSSQTNTPNSWAVMQGDGNLVVYRPDGSPAWNSVTADKPGSRLELQNDSNLVIYQGGTAVWDRHRGRHGGGAGGGGGTTGGVIGDDYPSYLRDAAKDAVIDPWRFYNRECTSFVAWRLNNANHAGFSNFMNGGRFGNADNWDNNARAIGMVVNSTPAVGAVAQNEGHVAWVAAVGNGTVTIEEYNRSYNGTYSYRTVPTSSFVYIHVKDLG